MRWLAASSRVSPTPAPQRAQLPGLKPSSWPSTQNPVADDLQVYLHDRVFVVSWWLAMLFRAMEMTYVVVEAWLYAWLLYVPYARDGVLRNIVFDVSHDALKVMVLAMVGIALLHGYALLSNLYASVVHRRLVFAAHSSSFAWQEQITKRIFTSACCCCRRALRMTSCWARFDQWWDKWITPVWYVEGEYFDRYILTREYVEVLAQVYQASLDRETLDQQRLHHHAGSELHHHPDDRVHDARKHHSVDSSLWLKVRFSTLSMAM